MTATLRIASSALGAGLAFALAVAACGHDELLRTGDVSAQPSLGGSPSSGGSGPDAALGGTGSKDSGSDTGSAGQGGSAGALADASSDGLAGAAGASADASDVVTIAPDFGLVDLNPSSAHYQATVSPRDYLGQVSAYYFGHST